jgi:hypothetical protein
MPCNNKSLRRQINRQINRRGRVFDLLNDTLVCLRTGDASLTHVILCDEFTFSLILLTPFSPLPNSFLLFRVIQHYYDFFIAYRFVSAFLFTDYA